MHGMRSFRQDTEGAESIPRAERSFDQRVFACDVEADVNRIKLFAGKIYPEEEVKE